MSEIKDTLAIEEEIAFLKFCSEQYEAHGQSPISDKEWDRRYNELKGKVPNHPYFNEVGGLRAIENGKYIKHLKPMGSLYKSKNIDDFNKWFVKQYSDIKPNFAKPDFGFLLQPKIDGLAITLIYSFGKLQMAITRGDGEIGVDVSHNIEVIDGILKNVPYKMITFEVRGEIYKDQEDFYENWVGEYSNPRNFAAGSMNLKSAKEVQKRGLSFIAYDIIGLPFVSEVLKINFLNQLGFNTLLKYTTATQGWHGIAKCVKDYIDKISDMCNDLPFAVDGIVVKINDLVTKDSMGYNGNGKYPNANRAIKFETNEKETVLLDIIWNTSKNGRVIPTGIYEEIEIGNTLNNRVTLNNYLFVRQEGIFPGAKIIIEKAGDIIPHFAGLVEPSKNVYVFPDKCTSCGTELIEKGIDLFCPNENCFARAIKNITYFLNTIGVKGISDITVGKLIEIGVTSIYSFYDIMYNKKTDLELILGKANYSNILSSLKANDKIPITVFLKAIGIPKVGSMVNRIIETFNINSIDKLSEFTPGQINSIHGFGIGKTKSFIKTIQDKKGEIEKLQKFITITFPDFHGNLYGVNFVFTGKFENPSRKELENIISKLDGNIQNSVSNSTHFLVWDGNINSSKLQKAKKLKTLIITKDQIVPMMDEKDK